MGWTYWEWGPQNWGSAKNPANEVEKPPEEGVLGEGEISKIIL